MINQNPWPLTPEDIRLAKALGEPAVDYTDLDLTPYNLRGFRLTLPSPRRRGQGEVSAPNAKLREFLKALAFAIAFDAAVIALFLLPTLLKP